MNTVCEDMLELYIDKFKEIGIQDLEKYTITNIRSAIDDFAFSITAKTKLGKELLKYRLLYILKGGKLLDQNEINKMVKVNRGEIMYDNKNEPIIDKNGLPKRYGD